jgi:hypothetical protein
MLELKAAEIGKIIHMALIAKSSRSGRIGYERSRISLRKEDYQDGTKLGIYSVGIPLFAS